MGQDRQMGQLPPHDDPGHETSRLSWESTGCGAGREMLLLARALQHVLQGRRYFKDVQGIRYLPDDQEQIRWKVYTEAMTLIRAATLCWAWLCANIKNYSICSHSFSSRNRSVLLLDVLSSHLIAKTKTNTASSFYLMLNWEDFFQTSFKKTGSPHWPPAVVCHNSSWSPIASYSQASLALKR